MPISNSNSGFTASELAALNLWRLPDFFAEEEELAVDSSSEEQNLAEQSTEAAQESIALPTVEDVETMQKQAYDEAYLQGLAEGNKLGLTQGYDEGFQQGLAQGLNQGLEQGLAQGLEQGLAEGRQQGYDEGLQKGYDENVAKLTEQTTRMIGLMETLSEPFKALDEEVEKELIELAIAMASQIIRREIKLNPGEVVAAVRAAIKVLPLSSQKINLHLHPEDAELVRNLLALDDMVTSWSIVEDPLISRGGCIVKTDVSYVNATVEHRLAAVIANMLGSEREED
ncbi:flagellar assembly protein FliH [Methylocucumis oryzae]|uniref:Flagellar assembly protein FliH n=1 Tax=Methylocucumis oryzae TaxID=1632867 RepID=A0A0F3IQL1_9GAMM|nr:flagellar assembly protein FliH [Methylocucumis oryzae]KJV07874.1 hypothetical protein VZ94_01930 [Methylocucumis oryzae]